MTTLAPESPATRHRGVLSGRSIGRLTRLAARRDRVIASVWVGLGAVIPASLVGTFNALYATQAERDVFASSLGQLPVATAFYGRIYDNSLGGLAVWRSGIVLVIVAIAAALTAVRHTRAEEDAGRAELLLAGPLPRSSPLLAAVCWLTVCLVALGLLEALLLTAAGVGGLGAWLAGATTAVAGGLAAAAALLAGQVATARPARTLVVAAIGVAFVLRGAGDVAARGTILDRVAWISPLRWLHHVDPYGAARWGILAATAAVIAVLVISASRIASARSLGSSAVGDRPGPPGGNLRGPGGLVAVLARGPLLLWSVGVVVLASFVGSAANSLSGGLSESPRLRDLLQRIGGNGALADAFVASTVIVLAMLVTAATLQTLLLAHRDEEEARTGLLLSGPLTRRRWHTAALVVPAALIPVAILALVGIGGGIAYGAAIGDVSGQLGRTIGAYLATVPAVWVITALTVLAHALRPGLTPVIAWGSLTGSALITEVIRTVAPDNPLVNLSPFGHLSLLPGGTVHWTALFALTVLSSVLMLSSYAAYGRRDLSN